MKFEVGRLYYFYRNYRGKNYSNIIIKVTKINNGYVYYIYPLFYNGCVEFSTSFKEASNDWKELNLSTIEYLSIRKNSSAYEI